MVVSGGGVVPSPDVGGMSADVDGAGGGGLDELLQAAVAAVAPRTAKTRRAALRTALNLTRYRTIVNLQAERNSSSIPGRSEASSK